MKGKIMGKHKFSFITRKLRIKLVVFILLGVMPFCSFAENTSKSVAIPIGISLWDNVQFPDADTDIMGMRFCLLYGRHANVSGFDFGVLGCGVDGWLFGLQTSVFLNNVGSANGALQLSGIVNNCLEDFYGIQLAGIASKTGGDVYGGQLALFNISNDLYGTQIGVFNKAENAFGIQLGVINMATDMRGIQLGVFNIIKEGPCPYLPIINMNF